VKESNYRARINNCGLRIVIIWRWAINAQRLDAGKTMWLTLAGGEIWKKLREGILD